jgi:hypothetical protein
MAASTRTGWSAIVFRPQPSAQGRTSRTRSTSGSISTSTTERVRSQYNSRRCGEVLRPAWASETFSRRKKAFATAEPPHSRLPRRSSFLSGAGPCRSIVRRMPIKSNAATGQWNQILCRPVKTLIRTRKPETVRLTAMGRGKFAKQSETKRIQVDGSCLSKIR